MSVAMSEHPLVEQITSRLRAEGGRMTAQRRLILETLAGCTGHPSAEDIFEQARRQDSSLHLSTVYRTLRWLEEEGFISPCRFDDERRLDRFDTVQGASRDHDHFCCRLCGSIIEFSEPLVDEIKAAYQSQFGGRVESASLTLYGVCEGCLEQN